MAAAARAHSEEFLRLVRPFERGEAFDRVALQAAYERMAWALLDCDSTRPLFATADVEPALLERYRVVPHGLALALVRPGAPDPPPFDGSLPGWSEADLRRAGKWGALAAEQAGLCALNAAHAAAAAGDHERAARCLAEAERFGYAADPRAQRVRAFVESAGAH
jgi:hypothetical protein